MITLCKSNLGILDNIKCLQTVSPTEKRQKRELIMSKATQFVVITSLSNPDKLAAYSELARPAVEAAGAKCIARDTPIAVKQEGEELRTIIEWASMEAADAG